MRARLYSPSKTAMSSGMGKARGWVLEFEPREAAEIDPLMGWTSSGDTDQQIKLHFETREAAESYANAHKITLITTRPSRRAPNLRANGYAENFAHDRRKAWTH